MTRTTNPKLRSFFERLDDAAPVAPSFERLTRPTFSFTPERSRRPFALALAAGTCVLTLLVALATLASVRSTSDPAVSDTTPARLLVATPVTGLPFAVLPAKLPDGWEIADIGGIRRDEPARPTESEFLFREAASGAAVFVLTTSDSEISAADPFGSDSFEANGFEVWAIDGGFVEMRVAGLDPARATELRQALVVESESGQLTASLPTETGLVLEASRLGPDTTSIETVWAGVVMTTPNGSATINMSTRSAYDVFDHFGVPVEVSGVTVYQSNNEVRRDPIIGRAESDLEARSDQPQDISESVWIEVTDTSDVEAATAVAAQLEAVPFDQWDAQQDRIAARLSQLPIVRTLSFDGVEITEHRSDDRTAVCAAWTGSQRCRFVVGAVWPVSLVVNDLWISVGIVDTMASVTNVAVSGDQGDAVGQWEPTDDGAFLAYAFPSATSADWQITTENGLNTDGRLQRPSH